MVGQQAAFLTRRGVGLSGLRATKPYPASSSVSAEKTTPCPRASFPPRAPLVVPLMGTRSWMRASQSCPCVKPVCPPLGRSLQLPAVQYLNCSSYRPSSSTVCYCNVPFSRMTRICISQPRQLNKASYHPLS
jgi:hypothetical protein